MTQNNHKASITGTGAFLPPKRLTNHDLERMVDTTDEWIIKRTGIRERRIVENGVATSDLAAQAAIKALRRQAVTKGRRPDYHLHHYPRQPLSFYLLLRTAKDRGQEGRGF